MQLRLFHPTRYEREGNRPPEGSIDIVCEGTPFRHYCWRCGTCGRRGMSLSAPRPDLLAWARANHRCPPTAAG